MLLTVTKIAEWPAPSLIFHKQQNLIFFYQLSLGLEIWGIGIYMNKNLWKQNNFDTAIQKHSMLAAPLTCWITLGENIFMCFFISSGMSSSNSSRLWCRLVMDLSCWWGNPLNVLYTIGYPPPLFHVLTFVKVRKVFHVVLDPI